MFFAHKRGEKIPAKSAQTASPTAITTCSLTVEFRQHTPAKPAVEGEGKSWWCIRVGSGLARNLDDLRALVQGLTCKGVRVELVKESLVFTGEDTPS